MLLSTGVTPTMHLPMHDHLDHAIDPELLADGDDALWLFLEVDSGRAIDLELLTGADDVFCNAELDGVRLAKGRMVQHSVPALEGVS